MTNAHGDFIWYELLTTDADKAQAFYSNVLGWTANDSGQPGMDYRILMADGEGVGGLMQLTRDMQAHGARPVWLGYVGVKDVDETVAAISDSGGTVQMPPMDVPNVGRIAMVTDPEGIPFYVMKGASEGTSTAFSPTTPGHCAWNELTTNDQQRAFQFYGRHFGWQKGDGMPMGDAGEYQFLVQNGATIGAFAPQMPQGGAPGWTYVFRVPDIDAAVEKTGSGGGQLLHGPHEVPGGEWVIFGLDPLGAKFALVGARKG